MNGKFFFYLFLISCNSTEPRGEVELNIIIKYEQSYILDLNNRVYTVFYFSKPTVNIKFDLMDEENNRIKETYYSLKLHKLSRLVDIRDKCNIDPKLYTYISITSKMFEQQIKIDANCERFYLSDAAKAKRIKKFVQLIRDIIESKPEIKTVPKSDIPYM